MIDEKTIDEILECIQFDFFPLGGINAGRPIHIKRTKQKLKEKGIIDSEAKFIDKAELPNIKTDKIGKYDGDIKEYKQECDMVGIEPDNLTRIMTKKQECEHKLDYKKLDKKAQEFWDSLTQEDFERIYLEAQKPYLEKKQEQECEHEFRDDGDNMQIVCIKPGCGYKKKVEITNTMIAEVLDEIKKQEPTALEKAREYAMEGDRLNYKTDCPQKLGYYYSSIDKYEQAIKELEKQLKDRMPMY